VETPLLCSVRERERERDLGDYGRENLGCEWKCEQRPSVTGIAPLFLVPKANGL
jgi:hypothetical protein